MLHQYSLIVSLHGAKHQLLYMTSSVLDHQLQLRLNHNAKTQMLSMTPSYLQNQFYLGNSETLPSPAEAEEKYIPDRCDGRVSD